MITIQQAVCTATGAADLHKYTQDILNIVAGMIKEATNEDVQLEFIRHPYSKETNPDNLYCTIKLTQP